jgi:EcsC protein family
LEIIPLAVLAGIIAAGVAFYLFRRNKRSGLGRLSKADADALRNAVALLERPSFAARLANMVGKPIELAGRTLPPGASQTIAAATAKSLEAGCKLALLTLRDEPQQGSQLLHKALAVASGATGGALGLLSLPLELPISTIIMLRSILDIARSEGEPLTDPESVLSCVAVLGLGARAEISDMANGSYFALRENLAGSVTEAALYIAERGVIEEASPVLARLIAQIATPFGLVVSEKAAAQTIPVIGALGGAAINYVFVDHFQAVARGHFTVRRLERKYGRAAVFAAYERVRQDLDWDS